MGTGSDTVKTPAEQVHGPDPAMVVMKRIESVFTLYGSGFGENILVSTKCVGR